jgi:hypothetical protein
METPVNFLEDTEKKLMSEMAVLFDKMKTQRDTISMSGIEDMYDIPPIEGVIYEPYLKIPITNTSIPSSYGTGKYYHSIKLAIKLPKNEVIVYCREWQCERQEYYYKYCSYAVTNYGRIITQERTYCGGGQGALVGWGPDGSVGNDSITVLDPLPYKLPKWFLDVFKSNNLNISGYFVDITPWAQETTASLQKLSKEFYLFAGKWKPHVTDKAGLDIEGMRETIVKNAETIAFLREEARKLEGRYSILLLQNQQLTTTSHALLSKNEQNQNLIKYKEAVIEFLENNVIEDIDKIHFTADYFRRWTEDKVSMDKSEYNKLIDSQEELKEYRIYKKVKKSMTAHSDSE